MQTKKIRDALFLISACAALCACGKGEEKSSVTTASSSGGIAATLQEAIENTKDNYKMDIESGIGYSFPYQIISDSLYYYAPANENFIRLDEDKDYYHSFERAELDTDEIYRFGMNVHGRAGRVADKDYLYRTDFMDLLSTYADDFTQMSEDTYCCTVKDLAYDLKEYFQNRAFSYSNYFEVHLGEDGRIASFKTYEKYLEGTSLVGEVSFKPFVLSTWEPYTLWDQGGRQIDLRIVDLKIGSQDGKLYRLLYQDQEVEIEGIVSGLDYDGHFILATESPTTGYIGIEVSLKEGETLPALNDKIKVKGIIDQDEYVAKLVGASYTKTGEAEYYPVFDEERVEGTYGGGYFAAYIFSQTPVYADSIYSTYAYLSSPPAKIVEDQDTNIEVICPAHTSEDDTFHMLIVLPSSMPVDERKAIVEDIKQYGIYSKGANSAKEISLDKFILRFSPSYSYHVKLEYTAQSSISRKLSPTEKVDKLFGLKDFPFPKSQEVTCFSCGGTSGLNIEANYGKEGGTVGLYYNAASLSSAAIQAEKDALIAYGFSFYDEIKDTYLSRHQIYKKGNTYVDILVTDDYYSEDSHTVSMWVYQGDLISMPSIEEILQEKAPFFDTNDFIRPAGIHSSDIGYYALHSYAGNAFDEGHYLSCVTLDVSEDCFSAMRSNYIKDKGYKTARTSDNKIYTYNTRGANHYVLYKEIPGSEEKIYLDMAMYPTSDYTFSGHNLFQNRIEVLIYKAASPLQTHYEENLNDFTNYMGSIITGGGFSVTFSTPVQVENYPALTNGGYDYLYYGYFYSYNAFIYSSSLEQAYQDIIQGLTNAGYTLQNTTAKGNVCYGKQTESGLGSFVFIIKETQKGYIRIMDGVGGLDF